MKCDAQISFRSEEGDIHGGPVYRAPQSQYRGPQVNPWSGNEGPT